MAKKQNFEFVGEGKAIDLSLWNFVKLETMNDLIREAFEELISAAVTYSARIDFQILQDYDYKTEEELSKTKNINNILIGLPLGNEIDGPFWSLDLIEEIKFQIENCESVTHPDDIKYGKIRLKVLSSMFKRCAQLMDESIAKEWGDE